MQSTWDLIVVGAGILGSVACLFCGQAGWRVLLLERGDWPGEASVRNFGTLMAGSLTGEWRRRGQESIAWYREVAPLAGFDFRPCGSLYHVTTDLEAAILEEFVQLGPEKAGNCELMQPADAAELNPLLNRETVRLALFFPGDARVEPRSLFRKLIPWMTRELPVDYRPATGAVRVTARGERLACEQRTGPSCVRGRSSSATARTCALLFPERFTVGRFQRCKLLMMRIAPQPGARLAHEPGLGPDVAPVSGVQPVPELCQVSRRGRRSRRDRKRHSHPDGTGRGWQFRPR